MISRPPLFALVATVAILPMAGSSARAAYSVMATLTSTSTPLSGFMFSPININVNLTPNPGIPISYAFLSISYNGTGLQAANASFTVKESFTVANTGFATATFSASFDFQYTFIAGPPGFSIFDGYTLALTGTTGFPATVAGVRFGAATSSFPTNPQLGNQMSAGELTTLTLASVPEPGSLMLLGLSLVGVAVPVLRRRAA